MTDIPKSRPSRDWLAQKYEAEMLNCGQIAQIVGRDTRTVCRWLEAFGIKRRRRSNRGRGSDRFWSRVDSSAGIDACWPWRGTLAKGYGCIHIDGKRYISSRLAYEFTNGPIPRQHGDNKFVVMHICDNPRCCNPAHLRLGTQRENSADRDAKGRSGPRARGEDQYFSVLTEQKVLIIRQKFSEGQAKRAIAREMGVSHSTIRSIVSGKQWGWLQNREDVSARVCENTIINSPDRIQNWEKIRLKILTRDNHTCIYCGSKTTPLYCDHILPASRGGSNEPDNLATACESCNLSKGDRTPEEWLGRSNAVPFQ